MHRSPVIIVILALFLGLVTAPFWANAISEKKPVLMPEHPAGHDKCVESEEFMRSSHMKLLHQWRDSAVREHNRDYVNAEGKHFKKSLVNTCMNCHTSKEKFCDRCHESVGVTMDCWNCHVAPEAAGKTGGN